MNLVNRVRPMAVCHNKIQCPRTDEGPVAAPEGGSLKGLGVGTRWQEETKSAAKQSCNKHHEIKCRQAGPHGWRQQNDDSAGNDHGYQGQRQARKNSVTEQFYETESAEVQKRSEQKPSQHQQTAQNSEEKHAAGHQGGAKARMNVSMGVKIPVASQSNPKGDEKRRASHHYEDVFESRSERASMEFSSHGTRLRRLHTTDLPSVSHSGCRELARTPFMFPGLIFSRQKARRLS